ncbi:hypothetical protein OF83DRAFT_1161116 [Amylostereum chailletii]|nr:hypothetical protein OF83DRAFT_1161116 [Amylostereum chailletii]
MVPTTAAPAPAGLDYRVRAHEERSIFTFTLARATSVSVLFGLSLASFIEEPNDSGHVSEESAHKKSLYLALLVAHTTAFILSVFTLSAEKPRARIANAHLSIILFINLAVYAYRDLWPLATFHLVSKDLYDRWIWEKIAILFLTAVVLPLSTPREYVPFDSKNPMPVPNPDQTAPLLSLAFLNTLDPLIFKANRTTTITHEDLPPLPDYDEAKNLVATSFEHLDTYEGAPTRHLFWGLAVIFSETFPPPVIGNFMGPIGVNRLLTYLETNGENAVVRPWVWVITLFLDPLIGTLGVQWYMYLTTVTLVRVEALVTQLVFEHSLRIRPTADSGGRTVLDSRSEAGTEVTGEASSTDRRSSGSETLADPNTAGDQSDSTNLIGRINNLISTDLANIANGKDFLMFGASTSHPSVCQQMRLRRIQCGMRHSRSCFQSGFSMRFSGGGFSAFVGMAAMVILFPAPGYLGRLMYGVQERTMKQTDARVQIVTETMNVLRMVKLFGWESKIDEKVAKTRDEELKGVRQRRLLGVLNSICNWLTTCRQTMIMKQELTPSKVFSSMAVFDFLRGQMQNTFYFIPSIIQGMSRTSKFAIAKVSLDRVTEFLQKTEVLDKYSGEGVDGSPSSVIRASVVGSDVIGFSSASFTWQNDVPSSGVITPSRRTFMLRVPNEVLFEENRINLIVGPTGSGKTSLLMALLDEMHYIPMNPHSWYSLPREKGIAYAAQESWVQNETIRDNILFGAPLDEARYKKVIHQCALSEDLALFNAGDMTEVGEKGLTLRYARVTLARAVYSSAQVLLLDDILAALDVHTAQWIVDKCLKGDLVQGRTVLLVTHNIAVTSSVSQRVIDVSIDGIVSTRSSRVGALPKDEVLSQDVMLDAIRLEEEESSDDEEDPSIDLPTTERDGKLMIPEEMVDGHLLKLYFSNLGQSRLILFWAAFLAGMLLSETSNAVQAWFLGYWAQQYDLHPASEVHVPFYLLVYSLFILFGIVVYTMGAATYVFGTLEASRSIHHILIKSILGTTLRWLDSTPISRVLTRCTQDILALDGPFAEYFSNVVELTAEIVIKLGAVVFLTPAFFIPGVVVAALGAWCGQMFIAAQLPIKREMSNTKAPVMGNFGAAIAGLTSIRAYGAQVAFRAESYKRIDRYTKAALAYHSLDRWIHIRMDLLAGAFTTALGVYLVYGPRHSHVQPSDAGFSLMMAVGFSGMILYWVRIFNAFEIHGKDARIQAYLSVEQEPKPTASGVPPAYWPASGDLQVEDLSARYSQDGPEILHKLSFNIQSGERVGVVGRTGSGKSSLTLALLRAILTDGKVYYDGLLTSSINLEDLRSNITIIPQVPELLGGTLRENLDPFALYADVALNGALRASGLFSLQSEEEDRITLDFQVSSGGGNLSVGQRQIVALARALLRESKLLILDEDYETDAAIQASLRRELPGDTTLITVAHRLQTIMDADKIMVLDAGNIVEFDAPKVLLKKEDGILRVMVDGSADRHALYAMAGLSVP